MTCNSFSVSVIVSVLDCLERLALITPEESVTLAKGKHKTSWDDSLLRVLEQKPLEVIDMAMDALAPFEDNGNILFALKCKELVMNVFCLC